MPKFVEFYRARNGHLQLHPSSEEYVSRKEYLNVDNILGIREGDDCTILLTQKYDRHGGEIWIDNHVARVVEAIRMAE